MNIVLDPKDGTARENLLHGRSEKGMPMDVNGRKRKYFRRWNNIAQDMET